MKKVCLRKNLLTLGSHNASKILHKSEICSHKSASLVVDLNNNNVFAQQNNELNDLNNDANGVNLFYDLFDEDDDIKLKQSLKKFIIECSFLSILASNGKKRELKSINFNLEI